MKLKNPEAFSEIITHSKDMFAIFESIESIAGTTQPVLVTGETGNGKEMIAHAIHQCSGVKGKMITVNMAGLDDNMFSDTLFGHVRGAFTGADKKRDGLIGAAADGTLVLDEIGDMTLPSQVKLLRLIQNGEYLPIGSDSVKTTNTRIVATTNADLWGKQRTGLFRKDLNYRLRTHHIHLPPLRERKEDILLLLDHFIHQATGMLNKDVPDVSPDVKRFLQSYYFAGNIRELEAMVFDAVSRNDSAHLSLELFRAYDRDKHEESDETSVRECLGQSLFSDCLELPTIQQITKMLIAEAIKRTDGKQVAAAKILGISQPALSKRLKNIRF